ncbi:unnamed protein product [Symbiodinium natans]|uniref:Methyltransferase type 11 domain-containing protein n=1 Tax=Symbiodinium natans TaxID=878477 RepID=A0A812KR16_9DINO|nr:unnamed protein product [Symbiodinium natans]
MSCSPSQERQQALSRRNRLQGIVDEFHSRVQRAQRGIVRLVHFMGTADFGSIANVPDQIENDVMRCFGSRPALAREQLQPSQVLKLEHECRNVHEKFLELVSEFSSLVECQPTVWNIVAALAHPELSATPQAFEGTDHQPDHVLEVRSITSFAVLPCVWLQLALPLHLVPVRLGHNQLFENLLDIPPRHLASCRAIATQFDQRLPCDGHAWPCEGNPRPPHITAVVRSAAASCTTVTSGGSFSSDVEVLCRIRRRPEVVHAMGHQVPMAFEYRLGFDFDEATKSCQGPHHDVNVGGVGAHFEVETKEMQVEPVVEIHYDELKHLTPDVLDKLRKAFAGPRAYGAVAITGIPGYAEKRRNAYRAGIDLALFDGEGRKRAAAVNNTYPGWSGTPGSETHPLQSSFLFNVKEELPQGRIDPFFGKNIFPSKEYRRTWAEFATLMHAVAIDVLRGCDKVMERDVPTWTDSPRSLAKMGDEGPALAGRFICYDSGFTREDRLLEHAKNGADESRSNLDAVMDGQQRITNGAKVAGHAGDGLASMRTHSTPVKSAGHAGDGLASMRTHSTPVKSAGHAGDGLASMRTHSTPVKSAGHAGDGLASMRTHSTPVKSAGHAGDGLASMRTHSTPVKSAGHAGDGLASMRTHSTPVKSAGHAGDGLASMRTHSTPVKSAGHAGDGLASMRTHSTPVKSAGPKAHANSNTTEVASGEQPGDYWLPWHVDSNFATILHKEMYASEATGEFLSEPAGAGLMMMNQVGETTKFQCSDPDALVLQMGAFGQIYTGGALTSCRHAVLNSLQPGVARFNYCNFWYVPWDTLCEPPSGMERTAISQGWNAMMDESYLNITMRQSFSAFRKFMVSPEARIQFVSSQRFKELSEILPLEKKGASGVPDGKPNIQVDLLTDVRCPFSFISQTNLEKAIHNSAMQEHVKIRFHPVFLNPNVSKEGESLDDYLWREFGYTKEYAHSEDYPLRKAGLKAGIELNPNRRVVNTFDAHCLIHAAQVQGKQEELERTLSRWYFEEAKDISDADVLASAAAACGVKVALATAPETKAAVQQRYQELSAMLGEVPHFVLREQISGNGVEISGLKSVEEWEEVLKQVVERGQFVGVTIDGPHGTKVRLDEANPFAAVSHATNAQHGWMPGEWPYQAEDFTRMDESLDTVMYAEPRLVEHLDDTSLERLQGVYDAVFQACPEGFSVLDLCSSWNSHYPEEALRSASRVAVHGLNAAELEANVQATERHVQDLNSEPVLPWHSDTFDVITLALSVQYLTDPRAVFEEMHRVLKPGGLAVVTFSHRAFIEKAVRVWAAEPDDGEGHAHLISRYFQFGPQDGWGKLSTVDVSPQHGDPVWIVAAVKQ